MTDNRNTILAVILSGLVLIAWQDFYNVLREAMTVYTQSGGVDVDIIFKKTNLGQLSRFKKINIT